MTSRSARSSARPWFGLEAALAILTLSILVFPPDARAQGPEPAGPGSAIGPRAVFVGPECHVRREGPLACEPMDRLVLLRGEVSAVQLVLEAGGEPMEVAPPVSSATTIDIERQIFLPVRARSRGRDPGGEALPWSAAARPSDASMMGELADPLCPASPAPIAVRPGRREALWLAISGEVAGVGVVEAFLPEGRRAVLRTRVLDAPLPSIPVSFFAYVETSELAKGRGPEEVARARDQAFDLVAASGVLPIDRATDEAGLDGQLRELGAHAPTRDLVVLGAYGTLGEPTEASVARAIEMALAVPASVRDVVLYAIDEQCSSDLGGRWRASLDAAGEEGKRIRVLVTCGDDPSRVDADVVMTPAERFDPAQATLARSRGKSVWVYNGRLPHAGTMALDAPGESLVWQGWIAARYDVQRWFFWNVNHWSDGNRGGLGPRDPFADPETFHNADGDAVLLDGLLLFPPRGEAASIASGCVPDPSRPLRSARLARLHRGLQDAALLALVATTDPAAARDALLSVVPAALAEAPGDRASSLGSPGAIQRARASLHGAIERAIGSGPRPSALSREEAMVALSELRGATASAGGALAPPAWSGRAMLGAGVVVVLAALVAVGRRRWARVEPR